MTPVLTLDGVRVFHGDCVEVMRSLPEASVDAVVTDPPYGLEFMGKEWDKLDAGLPQENVWKGRRGKGGSNISEDDSKPASRHHVSLGMGKRHQFRRCTLCNKRQFSGSPCKCDVPAWVVEYASGPPSSSVRAQRWHQAWAAEALRILKPGGHLLAFGGTRTWHRLAVAIEDAGFEVRDSIAWMYGSGFPKSLDVSKAIDKANGRQFEDRFVLGRHIRERREASGITRAEVNAWFGYADGCEHWERQDRHGARIPTLADWRVLSERLSLSNEWLPLVERAEAEREVVGERDVPIGHAFAGETYGGDSSNQTVDITAPATPAAQQWQGWGTALKPAFEPIVVARKPLIGTVAENVLTHGTGALNIDGCRISTTDDLGVAGGRRNMDNQVNGKGLGVGSGRSAELAGRWPANVILDESQAAELDRQSGKAGGGFGVRGTGGETYANGKGFANTLSETGQTVCYGDSGGASRFFYCAKAPKKERPNLDGIAHPTVKPLTLMQYLCRLITPPGGTILDPFAGSGTTIEAAISQGFNVIGIERETDYLKLIEARLNKPTQQVIA